MNRAFTLIELSIVLVVIGLLVGGILAGMSLIRASELRSVTVDLEQYEAAIRVFQDKYLALPGDMTNATRFWGEQHATPATCQTTASTSTLTCNGNGDGRISSSNSADGVGYEAYRAWQHLANAGLVSGVFSGIPATTGAVEGDFGVNLPLASLSGVGYHLRSVGPVTDPSHSWMFLVPQSVYAVWVGSEHPVNGTPTGGAFSGQELWNIDTKIDDGKPAYGVMMVHKASSRPNCATTDVPATALYDLVSDSKGCNFFLQAK